MGELESRLESFREENRIFSKGKLSVVLVVTRHARDMGLPLDPKKLVTKEQGQVLGLGKAAVQSILADHGIKRLLAEEGGRTSRGSIGQMSAYVEFLNKLRRDGLFNFQRIENWWIDRVKGFFSSKGFTVAYDPSRSLRSVTDGLLTQAFKLQDKGQRTTYAGAMLQHLVGAKLSLVLPDQSVDHRGYSVADASSGQTGDFMIDDVVVHVTTTPTEALLRKCGDNLQRGARPIIVTTSDGLAGAQSLAKAAGIESRVDIMEAGQFIAANLYELSLFKASERRLTVEKLVERYNKIVQECETDPGLKISFAR